MRVLQLQVAKGVMEMYFCMSSLPWVLPPFMYMVVMLSHPLLMLWFQFPSCFSSFLRNTIYRQKRVLPYPLNCLKGGPWYNHVSFVRLKVGVYFLCLVKKAHKLGFCNILAECSQGPRVSWQHYSTVLGLFTFKGVSKFHRAMLTSLFVVIVYYSELFLCKLHTFYNIILRYFISCCWWSH
jgi:hypothetical protein